MATTYTIGCLSCGQEREQATKPDRMPTCNRCGGSALVKETRGRDDVVMATTPSNTGLASESPTTVDVATPLKIDLATLGTANWLRATEALVRRMEARAQKLDHESTKRRSQAQEKLDQLNGWIDKPAREARKVRRSANGLRVLLAQLGVTIDESPAAAATPTRSRRFQCRICQRPDATGPVAGICHGCYAKGHRARPQSAAA